MKKKLVAVLCIITMTISLTGCGNAIPEMSEDESAMVAEYAAGLLLKYDKNYSTRLVDEHSEAEVREEITEQPEEQKEVKEETTISENQLTSQESEMAENGAAQEKMSANIGSFLELDSIQVDYQGFEILDSYSEGNGEEITFAMDASTGAKLVVAKFTLTNTGTEDAVCDILSKNPRFRINYGTATKNTLVTMLSDDLSTLNKTIPAGETVTAVLVIEVKTEETTDITGLSLNIKYNNNSITTILQSSDTVTTEVVEQSVSDIEETRNEDEAIEETLAEEVDVGLE